MGLTFQDIRLKVQSFNDQQDQLKVCKDVVTQYCQQVFEAFEKETGLKAVDHYQELIKTTYFDDYFQNVTLTSASIYYVVRKKSFFKDAIILKGMVFFDPAVIYPRVYLENSSADPAPFLKQFVNEISTQTAMLKKGP